MKLAFCVILVLFWQSPLVVSLDSCLPHHVDVAGYKSLVWVSYEQDFCVVLEELLLLLAGVTFELDPQLTVQTVRKLTGI